MDTWFTDLLEAFREDNSHYSYYSGVLIITRVKRSRSKHITTKYKQNTKEGSKREKNGQKAVRHTENKMAIVIPSLLEVPLNINELFIKRHRVAEWMKL